MNPPRHQLRTTHTDSDERLPEELVATIREQGIPIFFEHDLARLEEFLRHRLYYGSAWDPGSLFPDIPEEEVRRAIAKIQSATSNGGEAESATDE